MLTNNELNLLYDAKYAKLHDRHIGVGYALLTALLSLYPSTKNIIDIGCNNGWLIQDCLDLGLNACGVDISESAKENAVCPKHLITIADIRKCPILPAYPKYDIGFCLEVLEHVEKEEVYHVLQTLRNTTNRVVVTASTVLDGGKYHLNVKNHSWWMEHFLDSGFTYRHLDTLNFHAILMQERFRPATNIYPQILQGVMIYDT